MPLNEKADAPQAQKLRDLASWYREFAERAGSSTIWETRLHMAEDLDREADHLERERIARRLGVKG
jgi:hypothetical protein